MAEQAVVMWAGWETPELHMLESWEMEKQRIDKVNQKYAFEFSSSW